MAREDKQARYHAHVTAIEDKDYPAAVRAAQARALLYSSIATTNALLDELRGLGATRSSRASKSNALRSSLRSLNSINGSG